MKFSLFIISFFTVVSSFAHQYHFAFAEAEYNWETSRIEASVSVSTHDFEHELSETGMQVNHLESYANDKMMQLSLSDKVLENFKIQMGAVACEFRFIGYEVLNSGMTYFYFESQIIPFDNNLIVQFDLMMNHNKEQQNKLSFINNSEKISVSFLQNERTQKIKLETTKP